MIGVAFLTAWVGLTFAVLGWFEPRPVPVSDVRLGGRYRVARRRVRVLGICPGTTFTSTLTLLDVDTGERATVTYANVATFTPRRFGK